MHVVYPDFPCDGQFSRAKRLIPTLLAIYSRYIIYTKIVLNLLPPPPPPPLQPQKTQMIDYYLPKQNLNSARKTRFKKDRIFSKIALYYRPIFQVLFTNNKCGIPPPQPPKKDFFSYYLTEQNSNSARKYYFKKGGIFPQIAPYYRPLCQLFLRIIRVFWFFYNYFSWKTWIKLWQFLYD